MARLKAGIIGVGFIAISHIEAIRRIGLVDLKAVTDINYDIACKRKEEYSIPVCYRTADELINDPEIDVIHNCTPNSMHYEINEKIISAGKHVFCEKPLTTRIEDAEALLCLLKNQSQIVHGINFNYRMNPLVQEMRQKVQSGELGRPVLVHGSYLQDWLLYDTDYSWRIEPEVGGSSRSISDIGSHWIDCIQTVLGARITEVCSDLLTAIPVRKKPKHQIETFSVNTDLEYEEVAVNTEDYGAVLIKLSNGVHGVFHVSQVSAGRKCYLNFEVNGTQASLYWNQETPDQMWMGFRDQHNQLVMRNPNLMDPSIRQYTHLAAGHPEGWNDALKNNIHSYYQFIREGKQIDHDPCDFANFHDGYNIMKVVDAILESEKERKWIKVK